MALVLVFDLKKHALPLEAGLAISWWDITCAPSTHLKRGLLVQRYTLSPTGAFPTL